MSDTKKPDNVTTQVVQNSLPSWLETPLKQVASEATRVYNTNLLTPKAPESSAVAPFSPETEAFLKATTARAQSGNAASNAGQQYITGLLGSKNVSDPYIEQVLNAGGRRLREQFDETVLPGINQTFSTGGRYGSAAHVAATKAAVQDFNKQAGDLAAQLKENEWQRRQQEKFAAAQFSPNFAALDYQDLGQLGAVGAAREGKAQQTLDEQLQKFYLQSEAPLTALTRYAGLLNLQAPTTSTQITPVYNNRGAGILGGALSGGGFGLQAGGGNPWYGLGGAALGGLLGGGLF